ncbi:MAG: glycosyltransferase family 4 protein [Planctomycetes bacterium]|nr:glycosyltransferase family 4 protein [Planctomycetota bacterium]
MRIAIIIERFRPARGGRERSTGEIARRLIQQGCHVDVVCAEGDQPGDGVNVVTLRQRAWGRTARLKGFVRAAIRHSSEASYDVTHAMLPIPGADIYQLRGGTADGLREAHLRMFTGTRLAVRTLTWPANRLRACLGRLEKHVLGDRRTLCLPVSRMVADEIERFYGRTENVRTIFNAVSAPQVSPETRATWRAKIRAEWSAGDEDFIMVCPAMNFRLKGVAETIHAFADFSRRHLRPSRLIVLGDDSRTACMRAARNCGVAGKIRFCRAVDDIGPIYAAADAVVLLSWYDPCSRVVLEATAFGVPSVTTEFNGAAEVLTGGGGFVVPSPADVTAVSTAFSRLAEPAVRAQCSEACRLAAGQVGIARHVDELMAIYNEVAAS